MKRNIPHRHLSAFTLVELSIVLALFGLLVGGVIAGKSLIHAAELRSVMEQTNQYIAAVGSFRDQYRYLPGDLPTATNYWASSASGNADGLILGAERFRAWEHLNFAGLVEQSFTGTQGTGGPEDFVIGSNSPNTRIEQVGFSLYYANMTATTTTYTANMSNMLTMGATMGTNGGPPIGAAFGPADAFYIDTKMDDGMPGTGKWVANSTGGGAFGSASTACTTSSSGTDYAGKYNVSISSNACSFFIMTSY